MHPSHANNVEIPVRVMATCWDQKFPYSSDAFSKQKILPLVLISDPESKSN